jgi:hypothetical protein
MSDTSAGLAISVLGNLYCPDNGHQGDSSSTFPTAFSIFRNQDPIYILVRAALMDRFPRGE